MNVIHNKLELTVTHAEVVLEYKDTRFECNSQPINASRNLFAVVLEYKDTRFECNSQLPHAVALIHKVVSECKDTRFECYNFII